MEATFVEKDCVFTHEGRSFESGGAWLADCSDGYRRGVVYVKPAEPIQAKPGSVTGPNPSYPRRGIVTDWHGNKIADASIGHPFRGGFGAMMRSVRFTFQGVEYAGRYGCDWAQACRVRSTRKVS